MLGGNVGYKTASYAAWVDGEERVRISNQELPNKASERAVTCGSVVRDLAECSYPRTIAGTSNKTAERGS